MQASEANRFGATLDVAVVDEAPTTAEEIMHGNQTESNWTKLPHVSTTYRNSILSVSVISVNSAQR